MLQVFSSFMPLLVGDIGAMTGNDWIERWGTTCTKGSWSNRNHGNVDHGQHLNFYTDIDALDSSMWKKFEIRVAKGKWHWQCHLPAYLAWIRSNYELMTFYGQFHKDTLIFCLKCSGLFNSTAQVEQLHHDAVILVLFKIVTEIETEILQFIICKCSLVYTLSNGNTRVCYFCASICC